MKQRIATLTAFVVTSVASAQLVPLPEAETTAPVEQSEASASQPSQTVPEALSSSPVTVTPSMAPQTAPQAEIQAAPALVPSAAVSAPVTQPAASLLPSTAAIPSTAPSVAPTFASPSTGIAGDNPGNANTGGVQVQSVTVQSAQENSQAVSDLLRRERLRKELDNEARVLERIEKGRLEDEGRRRDAIEGFETSIYNRQTQEANAKAPLEIVQVTAPEAPVVAAPVAPVAVSESRSFSNPRGRGEVRIAPHAGYRWFENNNSQLKARNLFLTGFGLEGSVNDYLAFEGSFTYGRDEFDYRYLSPGSYVSPNYMLPSNYGYYPNTFYGPQALAFPVTRSRDSYEAQVGVKVGMVVDRVRPYVSAGIGGIIQKYNIDDSYTTAQARAAGWSRTTTQVLANLGGGLNVSLADNLMIGARFDYQPIVNRKSNDPMNMIYGDSKNRYRTLGELSLRF